MILIDQIRIRETRAISILRAQFKSLLITRLIKKFFVGKSLVRRACHGKYLINTWSSIINNAYDNIGKYYAQIADDDSIINSY